MTRATGWLPLLLLIPALASCGGARTDLSAAPSAYGSPTPRAAVRTFLSAANRKDYQAMGRQFGTAAGPAEAAMGVAELEQRMVVLAEVLRHDQITLERADLAQLGPDRTRYVVQMTGTRNGRVRVPVVTVGTEEGRWYVERLDIDALSGPGPGGG